MKKLSLEPRKHWYANLMIDVMFIVDDARLLLGVHYHGLGNWERIRLDERLLLVDKLAPQGATSADTSLPRSTHLEARVNALLRKVWPSWYEKFHA